MSRYKKSLFWLCNLVLICILLLGSHAKAAVTVKAEPNLYDDVNIISLEHVKPLLLDHMSGLGFNNEMEIKFHGVEGIGLATSLSAPEYQISLTNLNLSRTSRIAEGTLLVRANNQQERLSVRARYTEFVEVPVVNSNIPARTTLDESMIEWMTVEKHRLKFDSVMNEDELLGMSVKRRLRQFSPVRQRDLSQPQIIARNDVVDIAFTTTSIELKTVGIAMDEGAKGDVIRVRNASSKKIVQAVIRNEKLVSVLGPQG